MDSFASFGRSAPWKSGRLQRPHSGILLMILAAFLPVFLLGIKYSGYLFEHRQEVLDTPTHSIYYKKCAAEVVLAVAQAWNPGKTLGEQKEAIYTAAAAPYNAARTCEEKISPLSAAIPGFVGKKSGVTLLDPSLRQFSYPPKAGEDYVKISVEKYDANASIGRIAVQTDDRDTAYAIPATCNLDVILAVPTNSDTPLAEIKEACKNFLNDNFLCTCGVYTSLIPYSGKLSIPSNRANAWTFKFPAFKTDDGSMQLLIGACLYGTKGIAGTALSEHYSWNNTACPIMFRRGSENVLSAYGDNLWYSGNLLSTNNPATRDEHKYIQMNLQPCTLSNASILMMQCAANCTEFSANPNAVLEPTADVASMASKCASLSSSGDKSNFIFAALEWASNMLQEWTSDPKQTATINGDATIFGSESKTTAGRKKAVVLVVNKPDHFEPGEMTYMGFSDDYKEEDVGVETIDFRKNFGSNPIKSEKGALQFTGGVSYSGGCYQCSSATNCTFTLKKRHTVKLVVAPTNNVGEIVFKNVKGGKLDVTCYVIAEREFFIDPGEIADDLTIQFSAKNVKFVSAVITNHVVSSGTDATCSLSSDGLTATITTNCQRAVKLTVRPTSWIQIDGDRRGIGGDTFFDLGEKSENIAYVKQGVDIISLCRGREEFINSEQFTGFLYGAGNRLCSYPLNGKLAFVIFELSNSDSDKTSLYINPYGSTLNDSEYSNRLQCNYLSGGTNKFSYARYSGRYNELVTESNVSFSVYINLVASHTTATLTVNGIYFGDPLPYDGSTITIPETVRVLVDVKPAENPHPALSYTNFNGSTTTHSSDISATINTDTTLTLFPKYTRQADGTYTATVNLTDIRVPRTRYPDEDYGWDPYRIELTDTDKSNRVITEGSISMNDSGAVITTRKCPSEIQLTVEPKYISSIKFDGDTDKRLVAWSTVFDLGERSANIGYSKEYVDVVRVGQPLPAEVICSIPLGDRQDLTYTLREAPAIIRFYCNNTSDWGKIYEYGTGNELTHYGSLTEVKGSTKYQQLMKNSSTLSFGCEKYFDNTSLNVSAIYFGPALSYNASSIIVPETTQVLVEVKPSDTTRPSVSYTDASGAIKTHVDDLSTTGPATIMITPKWTEIRKNHYTAKIDLKNISSVSAAFTDPYEGNVSSDSGNLALRNATDKEDPTEGAKEMTNKWCDKLKADYGSNFKLYVVEHGTPSEADMSYIEKCATDTGGKVKKASDASGLKTALDEIAADLKTFGGYQEARVVN